ncbi:hypothetical protein [Carnobacterium sp. TMP28]|uniref:hypothetical protein n=1 Tax=Carnobacterium sp. TMP28 TaxID=3397060 RepID=UPI0039E160E7
MNQRGAILPSVVIFVFLLATVMIGTSRIYKNQMQQMMLTENYYLIHTMIALSKVDFQRQLVKSPTLEKAVFNFEDGKVEVDREKENVYVFIGKTKNNLSNPIKVSVSFPNKEKTNTKSDPAKSDETTEVNSE